MLKQEVLQRVVMLLEQNQKVPAAEAVPDQDKVIKQPREGVKVVDVWVAPQEEEEIMTSSYADGYEDSLRQQQLDEQRRLEDR